MNKRSDHRDGQFPILNELGFTRAQILRMATNERNRLLYFLLRWRHLDALHACLDYLIPQSPTHVTLYDLRARAFLAQGRHEEALDVMAERLSYRASLKAQVLLAHIHLARGDVAAARQIAHDLIAEREESVMAWALLGRVELAATGPDAADWDAAADAYRRLRELRPHGRAYLRGMLAFHQAQGDLVAASGYAVQLLNAGGEEAPLSVADLRLLRDYFSASGEQTRLTAVAEQLARCQIEETDAMGQSDTSPEAEARPRAPDPSAPPRRPEPAEQLPALDQIPVSDEERRAIAEATHRLFGFDTLLPGQLETIACVMRGEDVFTILPTGGGKSLCYQLPAVLDESGVTLVISPLIALMKDQVDSLPRPIRQRATTINSSLDGDELRRRMEHVAQGAYRLVYAAPERLRQPPFLHAIRCAGVNRLVIDEAHCVSMWGHDFRPDYLMIGQARRGLGDPPLLAMTATAPHRVRRDVVHRLSDAPGDMRVIAGDATRPNLQLAVFHARNTDEKQRRLLAFCRAESGSGIVYAGTRARCEELAALLRRYGVDAAHYHAGIPNRAQVQDDFMADRVRVVAATVAFGMGIDKADIRFIVHFVPPPSLESYYQEAGRAGRDGRPARCLMMYTAHDRATLTRRMRRDALPIPFLRQVYAAVKSRLDGQEIGQIAIGDLERDLRTEGTRIRVALSMLEEAQLLQRGPDIPCSALVRLAIDDAATTAPAAGAQAFAAFCRAACLRPAQWLTVNLCDIARQAALSPMTIERDLLQWEEAGWINYRPSGRDMLLGLRPPPSDAADRVADLLERHETVQSQRVDEIAAYAKTTHCRHGHLNAYLGGRVIERCEGADGRADFQSDARCDNCLRRSADGAPTPSSPTPSSPTLDLPGEREQLLVILQCVENAPWSWGRRTLTRILRGDVKSRPGQYALHQKAREQAEFGALAFRSRTAVERLIRRLEHAGLLAARRLDHGGAVLDLTPDGKAALADPTVLDELA
jgi:ATP-dependent DNA helicase RecQ